MRLILTQRFSGFVMSLCAITFCPASSAKGIEWLSGTWEVDIKAMAEQSPEGVEEERAYQCQSNPHKIVLLDSGNKMLYSNIVPVEEKYTPPVLIVDHGDNYVAVECDRTVEDANCNEWNWYIFFKGPNEHFWVREDWLDESGKITGHTISRFRCQGPFA